jgi:hypothetical protein
VTVPSFSVTLKNMRRRRRRRKKRRRKCHKELKMKWNLVKMVFLMLMLKMKHGRI